MGCQYISPTTGPIMLVVVVLLGSAIALHNAAQKINYRQRETEILDKILGGFYDSRVRPVGANGTGPTEVGVNLYLRYIDNIDDYKMDSSRIWTPDIFFPNEKQGHLHNFLQPNVYIRIYPDGGILYIIRQVLFLLNGTIKHDKLDFFYKKEHIWYMEKAGEIYKPIGWTTEDVIFKWKKANPIQVTPDLHLPRFSLEQFTTDYCDTQTDTGTYSCIMVNFLFRREITYYFKQIYIPCCLLVIASWISFWMDQSAAPERISLVVAILLTMVTQTSGINENLPLVSYTKALDLWTTVCLAFVFGALIEFALVNYVSRADQQHENGGNEHIQNVWERNASLNIVAKDRLDDGSSLSRMLQRPMTVYLSDALTLNKGRRGETNVEVKRLDQGCFTLWWSEYPRRKRIDMVSRALFPLLFILFNLGYWNSYLSEEEIKS